MLAFFNNLGEIINQVFGSAENRIPLSEYTGWHFVVMVFFGMLTVTALALATYLLLVVLFNFFRGCGRLIATLFSAKKRCSKVQCPHCGRTLDKCVCSSNTKNGYIKRLALYSKEKKNAEKARKIANKNKKA